MKRKWIYKIPLLMVLGVFLVFLFGWVVMSLWNWLIPDLFKGPQVNLWQALGLLVLSKILFGGFHKNHHKKGRGKNFWRKKFEEKLARMSPEDREKFKAKFNEKFWNRCYEDRDTTQENM